MILRFKCILGILVLSNFSRISLLATLGVLNTYSFVYILLLPLIVELFYEDMLLTLPTVLTIGAISICFWQILYVLIVPFHKGRL